MKYMRTYVHHTLGTHNGKVFHSLVGLHYCNPGLSGFIIWYVANKLHARMASFGARRGLQPLCAIKLSCIMHYAYLCVLHTQRILELTLAIDKTQQSLKTQHAPPC